MDAKVGVDGGGAPLLLLHHGCFVALRINAACIWIRLNVCMIMMRMRMRMNNG